MVSSAIHCGSERPATMRSDADPRFTLRAARMPTARNAARMNRKTVSAKLGFYLEAVTGLGAGVATAIGLPHLLPVIVENLRDTRSPYAYQL
jgi:hypothetical protein